MLLCGLKEGQGQCFKPQVTTFIELSSACDGLFLPDLAVRAGVGFWVWLSLLLKLILLFYSEGLRELSSKGGVEGICLPAVWRRVIPQSSLTNLVTLYFSRGKSTGSMELKPSRLRQPVENGLVLWTMQGPEPAILVLVSIQRLEIT